MEKEVEEAAEPLRSFFGLFDKGPRVEETVRVAP